MTTLALIMLLLYGVFALFCLIVLILKIKERLKEKSNDDDDLDKKIVPLFDMKAGFIVGSIYGFGFYTQFMGGVSFRPSIMTIFNLSAGAKLTGAFTEFEYVVWPDIFGVDGVVDASFTLNFLYLIGLKGGVTFSFGSSGYGAMPYISIVTAFKDFGLRLSDY